MLKTLLKKQMAEIFRNYFYDPKKNKMRSRGATIAYIALYALLMVGLLGGMFALMAVGLCGPLVEGGMGWLYYLLMGLIAVFLGTFGSVFSTYSSLYLSKDNDLLLSLPIPVRCVMASRLLGVYLLGLMYAAVVIVPGVIVYWLTAPVTAGTIVGGVLMVLIVSVIVMVLSCLLGWVVARISLKLKNKSFITVLLSLLFLAAYYFVYYKAQALITLLVENAAGVLSQVSRLFSRKGYNIESIVSGETDKPGITRISIEILADELMIEQIAAQCRKLLPVKAVKILDEDTCIRREIALIKVSAADHSSRDEIIQLVSIFRAKVIDVSREALTIWVFGSASKNEALINMLEDFGILEIAKTGTIAIERGRSTIYDNSKLREEYDYGKNVL